MDRILKAGTCITKRTAESPSALPITLIGETGVSARTSKVRSANDRERVITDRAVFAYLADVFVVPEWRGRGISKALVGAMLDHPDVSGLRVILLRTRDAHGLYAQFGFAPIAEPSEMMALYPKR